MKFSFLLMHLILVMGLLNVLPVNGCNADHFDNPLYNGGVNLTGSGESRSDIRTSVVDDFVTKDSNHASHGNLFDCCEEGCGCVMANCHSPLSTVSGLKLLSFHQDAEHYHPLHSILPDKIISLLLRPPIA